MEAEATTSGEERHSVSELVRNYSDSQSEGHGKRDRSESGDAAPAGKRGARERDSEPDRSTPTRSSIKEYLETAIDKLEDRITTSISKDLHEFRECITTEISALHKRVKDLETHVEEKDNEVAELSTQLQAAQKVIRNLKEKTENTEMNSRIPCLVLSGRAMARRAPRLDAPLPPPGAAVPRGAALADRAGPAEPADARPGVSGARAGTASGRTGGGRDAWEAEDVNKLVIDAVRARLPGLDIREDDIDRAHRLPGPNHRVIIRFVQSGSGSVRDQLMSRRLELRGREDLYINESLTQLKGQIFRSLLEAKKTKKVYTVYTRWGHVYFKAEKFGTSARVDSLDKLRELRLPVMN